MTTMLDKVAVAGDITQAINRAGCWTAAIVVIGGVSETAVKLMHCDTSDGDFTEYKTLIPTASVGTTQYKGFVVDLTGAKQFVKVTGSVMATAVFGDCDSDVKQIQITAGDVPEEKVIEKSKAVTIDVSEYTEPVTIEPTEGKDGMAKVVVTLSNIPEEAGE